MDRDPLQLRPSNSCRSADFSELLLEQLYRTSPRPLRLRKPDNPSTDMVPEWFRTRIPGQAAKGMMGRRLPDPAATPLLDMVWKLA